MDDRPTFEMINRGETIGVFQLESPAQRALQSRFQASEFEDMVASMALIRPGPIKGNMVDPYVARRLGQEEVSYMHPWLEPILNAVDADVLVTDDADAFKKISDETGRAHQVCKSHVGRNTDALVDELSAIIQSGQDPSLSAMGIKPEQALADLSASKVISALKAYRSGQRFHPMMQFFVIPMSEQDMEDIGAYYASVGVGPNLYERLGGKEAINAVVKDLLANGMADARLKPRLSGMDGARCERQLTDLLCQATGGPCKYTGRDMKTAHVGARVTETEWQAFAENLVKTFDRFNVPERERGELMQLVGPMKADIVGH